jgi:hypothetical protein
MKLWNNIRRRVPFGITIGFPHLATIGEQLRRAVEQLLLPDRNLRGIHAKPRRQLAGRPIPLAAANANFGLNAA